jgi:septum formation protein
LLQQAGLEPDALLPADVDEAPARGESPRELARRLARAKAEVARRTARNREDLRGGFIVSADTVVTAAGRRILPKAEVVDEAAACLRLLSGRTHRVYTAVCVVTPRDHVRERIVETRLRFKRLSRDEIESYLASGEWRGKAGGYAIQGVAGAFVVKLVGSYTNVVGLPLYETMILLDGEGFPVRFGWLNAA